MRLGIWKTLGIEPTRDEREIRRAYARQLKSLGSDPDPQAFGELRQAYTAALAAAEAGEPPAAPPPPEVETAAGPPPAMRLEAAAERRRLAAILAAEGPPAALLALRELLQEDRGLAAREELETALSEWLAGLEKPPLELIAELDAYFGWQARLRVVGFELAPEVDLLLGQLVGRQELEQIRALAPGDRGILSVVGDWLQGTLDLEQAAQRLRRAKLDQSHLEGTIDLWPNAFQFAIPAELTTWLADQLPEPPAPGPWQRLRRRLAAAGQRELDYWTFGRALHELASGLLFAAVLSIALGRDWTNPGRYALLAALLPFLVELARVGAQRLFAGRLTFVPSLLLFTLLALAAAAALGFQRGDYPFWWAAGLLAIHLSFEKPRTQFEGAAEAIGFGVLALALLGRLQVPPFFYLLAPALLGFPGSFFGRLAPSPAFGRNFWRAAFALAVLAAAWAPAGGDSRRLGLAAATLCLLLLWRASERKLANLWVAPLLVWLAARISGAGLAEEPAFLLLFLWPWPTAADGARWLEKLGRLLHRPLF